MFRTPRRAVLCCLLLCCCAALASMGCAPAKHVGKVGKLELRAERDGDLVLTIYRGGEMSSHHLDDAQAADIVLELRYILTWDERRKPTDETIERQVWEYKDFRGKYVATPDRIGSYLIMEWGNELDWFEYGIATLNKKQIMKLIEILDKTELKYSQSVS